MVQSIPGPSVAPPVVAPPNPIDSYDPFYPDCDGQPVANNTEQFEIIFLIKGNLDILYGKDPNVLIAGDLFWYPIEGNNKVKYAPDILVALGRPKGMRYSYKQWQEGNQPPQVVFEILSPNNTDLEMARKLLFYDRYGVEEYYIYNPMIHTLQVWQRTEQGLDCVMVEGEWVSARLGIRFDMVQPTLTLYHPDGRPFLSFLELEEQTKQERQRADKQQQRADEQQQRADEQQQRADEQQQRADEQQQRADRLAARLREMGLDPDQV